MANRSSTRYNLRSRKIQENVQITPEQILNTFYGAFFEPLISSNTKEFSFDFLNEENCSKKFPNHWKFLLRNESNETPVKTYTIVIENLHFLTIKYFASPRIERFIIIEPSFLEKLKDEFGEAVQEQSSSAQTQNKLKIRIPLPRAQKHRAQNLRVQPIENCRKKFYITYVLPELQKPTLLLGYLFSLPEFKKALIDLDYVTNAVQKGLQESKFIRKEGDVELSCDEPNKSVETLSSDGELESQPQEETAHKLFESFKSLRPEESNEYKEKLAMLQLDKIFSDSANSSVSNSAYSLMNHAITNSRQPVNIVFNVNQGEGIQTVHVGRGTPSDSVYLWNKSQLESSEKSLSDQLTLMNEGKVNFYLVLLKFSKLKIGILSKMEKYAISAPLEGFYKTGKLEDIEQYTGRMFLPRISFSEYITNFGRKILAQKYLASFSTKDFETFRNKRGLVSSQDIEGRKIFMVHQNEDLNLKCAEAFSIKIRNRNVKKYFELFEIAKENIEETCTLQPLLQLRKDRLSKDSGYDNLSVSKSPNVLSDATSHQDQIGETSSATNVKQSEICEWSFPMPSTSGIKQSNVQRKEIANTCGESSSEEIVEDTDFAQSPRVSPLVPQIRHGLEVAHPESDASVEHLKHLERKNMDFQTSDEKISSCRSPSYEDRISDISSSDFFGFSDDDLNNEKRGIKYKNPSTSPERSKRKKLELPQSKQQNKNSDNDKAVNSCPRNHEIIIVCSDSDSETNYLNEEEITQNSKIGLQEPKRETYDERPANDNFYVELNQTLNSPSNLFINPYLVSKENNSEQLSTSNAPVPEPTRELSLNCPSASVAGPSLHGYDKFAVRQNVVNNQPSECDFDSVNNHMMSTPEANMRPEASKPFMPVPVRATNYSANNLFVSQRQNIPQNDYGGLQPWRAMHTTDTHPNPVPSNSFQRIDQRGPVYSNLTENDTNISSSNMEEQQQQQTNYMFQNFSQDRLTSYIPPEQFAYGDQRSAIQFQGFHQSYSQLIPRSDIMLSQPTNSFVQPNINMLRPLGSEYSTNMLLQRYNDFLGQLQGLLAETRMARDALIQNTNNQNVVILLQQSGNNTIVRPINLDGVSSLPQVNSAPRRQYPYINQ